MRTQLFSRLSARQLHIYKGLNLPRHFPARSFHASTRYQVVKPFLLADIGEGIRECEIIQWFVEPEARVEEWDKLCEVQSDKASVEITSRFAGVIKKLHYEAGEMAKVGQPLLDIDIQGEIKQEDLDALTAASAGEESQARAQDTTQAEDTTEPPAVASKPSQETPEPEKPPQPRGKHATLATPAVRHLTKELNVNIADVQGTGRDGRVLKEDVYQFAKRRDTVPTAAEPVSPAAAAAAAAAAADSGPQKETITQLTNTQAQMFKTMTRSLSIPHFVYADEIDFTKLSDLRQRLNQGLAQAPLDNLSKLSYLPFIIKAVSMALHRYPSLNARVDVDRSTSKPVLVLRSQHNIGIAMDTPSGLIVPVIKNVSQLSIHSIALELSRLQSLAATGRFPAADLTGGTITISNIGNIGGTYVSPVLVDSEVAILGIGKVRPVPAFDEDGQVVRKQISTFSWSADHRVIDGATMARAAELVRGFVENPDTMLLHLS